MPFTAPEVSSLVSLAFKNEFLFFVFGLVSVYYALSTYLEWRNNKSVKALRTYFCQVSWTAKDRNFRCEEISGRRVLYFPRTLGKTKCYDSEKLLAAFFCLDSGKFVTAKYLDGEITFEKEELEKYLKEAADRLSAFNEGEKPAARQENRPCRHCRYAAVCEDYNEKK